MQSHMRLGVFFRKSHKPPGCQSVNVFHYISGTSLHCRYRPPCDVGTQ